MRTKNAVVVGGGFSGLLAAFVLSKYFENITVLDKDPQVGSDEPRSGAVQSAHLHVLLKRGQEILFQFFPEMELEFIKSGCPVIDWSDDTLWENALGLFPRYSSTVKTFSLSRVYLESLLFKQVCKMSNIRFVNGSAIKLRTEQGQVVAVETREQDSYPLDMLIIAGGQNFPLQRLFPELKIELTEQVLPIHITYRSVIYQTDSLNFKKFRQYYYQLTPPLENIGGVICPIEGGRTIATIVEQGSSSIGRISFDDFEKLAEKIPGRTFSEIVKNGNANSEVSVFHKPSMYRRPLHKVEGFPSNVFVLGDSFCSLNPVYGQGMTNSLEQVLILEKMTKNKIFCSGKFHQRIFRKMKIPFLLSKIGSSTKSNFAKRYMTAFLKRCQTSPYLHTQFLNVLHQRTSAISLFDLRSLLSAGLLRD